MGRGTDRIHGRALGPGVTRSSAWSFALPFLSLFLRLHGRADPGVARHELHRPAGHGHPQPVRRQLRRDRQLRRRLRRPDVPQGGGEHGDLRPRRRAARRSPSACAPRCGLNQGIVKFRTFFRVGFYLPVVTSIVAIAVVWRILLGTETGLVNGVLERIRHRRARAGSPTSAFALWSLIADGRVAQPRVPDGHLPRRAADDPRATCTRRRRSTARTLAAIPRHHAPAPATDAAVRRRDHQHRLRAVLRGAVRDDRRAGRSTRPCRSPTTPTTSSASATTATPRRSATCCSSRSPC